MRILILSLLLTLVFTTTPFMDIWEEIDDAKCTVQSFTDVCLRVYQSVGKIEPNFAKNIKLTKDSGVKFTISAYVVPCIKVEAPKQAAEILAGVKNVTLKMLWVAVEGFWEQEQSKTHEFLTALMTELKKGGVNLGIQTDWMHWTRVMGHEHSAFAEYPLWFVSHDRRPDGGFRPFGG